MKKSDAAVDKALDVLEDISYTTHPITMEKIRDFVQVLLRELGQRAAADRWAGISSGSARGSGG